MTEDELKQKVKQIVIEIDRQYSWQDVDLLLTYIDLLEFKLYRHEQRIKALKEDLAARAEKDHLG